MQVDAKTLKWLESLPTLATGQAEDLKIETTLTRVWLSRVEQDEVTIEVYATEWIGGHEFPPHVELGFLTEAARVAGYAGVVVMRQE
jgi:hypothetical protein